MEKSRHIPTGVQRQLKSQHYFECAWCCTKLTDQHHIEEYALGGGHTVENLILLCPNCHRQVHQGAVTDAELRERKSTHLRGDRVTGYIPYNLDKPVFNLGGIKFINVEVLMLLNGIPFLTYKTTPEKEVLISVRFYSRQGNLIFWMSDNRYWAPIDFEVNTKGRSLSIVNHENANNHLKIWKEGDVLQVQGAGYVGGIKIEMTPELFLVGGNTTSYGVMRGCTMADGHCGIKMDFWRPPLLLAPQAEERDRAEVLQARAAMKKAD